MFGSIVGGLLSFGKTILDKIGIIDSAVDLGKRAVERQKDIWLGVDKQRSTGPSGGPTSSSTAVSRTPRSVGNVSDLLVPRGITGNRRRSTWGEYLKGAVGGAVGTAGLSAAEQLIPFGGPSQERSSGGTGVLRPLLNAASNNIGQPVTTKKIVSTIRQFGFERASQFFGLSPTQLSYIWLRGTQRRKTRFTSNDKRRARGYIRHLKRCEAELKSLRPTARRTYRRRSTK